jgi:hypothetical protein
MDPDPCDDREVPSLFAAYLRVYEPLAAFDRERQVYWRRYVKEGRAVAPLEGPNRQRTSVIEALGASWTRLPNLPDEAYVLEWGDSLLICPWNLRVRVAEAALTARDGVPEAHAILERSLGDVPITQAVAETSRWLDEFHDSSLVELDYGGLVALMSDEQLVADDSPGLIAHGLTAVAEGRGDDATKAYEQLVERWRAIQLLERCN